MEISGLFKKLCYDLILTFLFNFSNSFLKLAVSIEAFEFFFFSKELFRIDIFVISAFHFIWLSFGKNIFADHQWVITNGFFH